MRGMGWMILFSPDSQAKKTGCDERTTVFPPYLW